MDREYEISRERLEAKRRADLERAAFELKMFSQIHDNPKALAVLGGVDYDPDPHPGDSVSGPGPAEVELDAYIARLRAHYEAQMPSYGFGLGESFVLRQAALLLAEEAECTGNGWVRYLSILARDRLDAFWEDLMAR